MICEGCGHWRGGVSPGHATLLDPMQPCLSCRFPGGEPRGLRELSSLPAEPLAELLTIEPLRQLARRVGCDEAWLRRIRRQRRVHLATADRICVALDHPLSELYPG